MSSAFLSATYIQVHFRQDFFMEANYIYPNQIPREQSDLGTYYLQYRLPKNISRREMQTTKVLTGELVLCCKEHCAQRDSVSGSLAGSSSKNDTFRDQILDF